MPADSIGDARCGSLFGCEQASHRGNPWAYLPIELGCCSAEQLDVSRAILRAMSVSRVCLDLSACAATDDAGPASLVGTCNVPQYEYLHVDADDGHDGVRVVLGAI